MIEETPNGAATASINRKGEASPAIDSDQAVETNVEYPQEIETYIRTLMGEVETLLGSNVAVSWDVSVDQHVNSSENPTCWKTAITLTLRTTDTTNLNTSFFNPTRDGSKVSILPRHNVEFTIDIENNVGKLREEVTAATIAPLIFEALSKIEADGVTYTPVLAKSKEEFKNPWF